MSGFAHWRAVACAALLLAGCGGETAKSVSPADLGEEVGRRLSAAGKRETGSVRCPALPGKRGARATCAVAVGGTTHDVAVTVSRVAGSRASFDIAIPAALRGERRVGARPARARERTARRPAARPPATTAAPELARQVNAMLIEMAGRQPDAVVCPDGLPAAAGSRVTCILREGAATVNVYVTATADGFRLRVDDKPNG